jgi:hypothetical protein
MDEDQMHELAAGRLKHVKLQEPEWEGAWSLLQPAVAIQPTDSGRHFINGQHRTQAMLQAGVRMTVVVRWAPPDSDEA